MLKSPNVSTPSNKQVFNTFIYLWYIDFKIKATCGDCRIQYNALKPHDGHIVLWRRLLKTSKYGFWSSACMHTLKTQRFLWVRSERGRGSCGEAISSEFQYDSGFLTILGPACVNQFCSLYVKASETTIIHTAKKKLLLRVFFNSSWNNSNNMQHTWQDLHLQCTGSKLGGYKYTNFCW